MKLYHLWLLPLISAITWWAMLIILMLLWASDGFRNYSEATKPEQKCLYISDVSAGMYKPIFITGSAIQGILFVLSMAAEIHLRKTGRLRPHCQWWTKWVMVTALSFAIVGQLGILFVAIFDTNSYPNAHMSMLVVYIVFVGISALLSVIMYASLDYSYINRRHFKFGLWLKVAWFLIEFTLSVFFISSQTWFINVPAVLEWTISFIYPFYQLIMVYDLWPAVGKKKGHYPKYNMNYPNLEKQSFSDSLHSCMASELRESIEGELDEYEKDLKVALGIENNLSNESARDVV